MQQKHLVYEPSEHEIQTAILHYLQLQGIKAIRSNSGMISTETRGRRRMIRLAPVGTPDILGCLPNGRFLAIEVKRPKNGPTFWQKESLAEYIQLGAIAFVARSVDDVKNRLDQEDAKSCTCDCPSCMTCAKSKAWQ